MESFAELLQYVKDTIKNSGALTPMAYDLWIKDIEPVSFDGVTAVLSVKAPLQKNMLNRYDQQMHNAFMEVLGVDVEIVVQVNEPHKVQPVIQDSPAALPVVEDSYSMPQEYAPAAVVINSKNGDYEYTFETFIVGTSNKFAHAAAMAVADKPFSNIQ